MIRHVAPTLEAARALMPSIASCPADTDGDGNCAACSRNPTIHGVLPPTSNLIVVEGVAEDGGPIPWDSYPPYPDPSFVRAVESGERIEIAAECPDCSGYVRVYRENCMNCRGSGLVVVGSVQATAVLPVVDGWKWQPVDEDEQAIMVFDPPYNEYPGKVITVMHRKAWGEYDNVAAALSVYGPPASLIGRFVVAVTDPRRTE